MKISVKKHNRVSRSIYSRLCTSCKHWHATFLRQQTSCRPHWRLPVDFEDSHTPPHQHSNIRHSDSQLAPDLCHERCRENGLERNSFVPQYLENGNRLHKRQIKRTVSVSSLVFQLQKKSDLESTKISKNRFKIRGLGLEALGGHL